jgi:hypothetical protein
MTYAGYKPNETASLGAITATGIDAITKINLEREKLDAARQVKKDALAAKAAQDKEKQAAKEAAELEKEKNSTKEKLSKNEGKTPFTINLQANMGEVGVKNIDLDPSSQNALIGQSSTYHALLGNQDATTTKLAENKNPSMQATWRYGRTIGDFQKQTVSTIVEGKGNDAKFIFKNEKGETVSMDGLGSIMINVSNTMPNLDEDYNNWYAQIGEQQKEVGRTSKLDVGAQNNFTTKKDEIKSLILADREKLGDRYYLVSQKLGKTPIFYSEGDDQEALRVKSGAVNPEYIKMVTTQNGETYAELTQTQKDAMKKDVDDELGIRVKKSQHTRPEGGGNITITQQIGEAKTKEAGKYYDKVIKGNNPTEAQFVRGAQAAGNILAGTTAPYYDPITKTTKDTPVYQNDGKGNIKILYEDKYGNIVQYKSNPSMTKEELVADLEQFYSFSKVKSGAEAVATTQAVTGKK